MGRHIFSCAVGGGVISVLMMWLLSMFGIGRLLPEIIIMALPGLIIGSACGLYGALSGREMQEKLEQKDGEAE